MLPEPVEKKLQRQEDMKKISSQGLLIINSFGPPKVLKPANIKRKAEPREWEKPQQIKKEKKTKVKYFKDLFNQFIHDGGQIPNISYERKEAQKNHYLLSTKTSFLRKLPLKE